MSELVSELSEEFGVSMFNVQPKTTTATGHKHIIGISLGAEILRQTHYIREKLSCGGHFKIFFKKYLQWLVFNFDVRY